MSATLDEAALQRLLDVIYDAAVMPDHWAAVLAQLAHAFDASFVDLFTRTQDRRHFSGLAHGLSRADYEDEFLGVWFKRNVWGNTKPVREAGEVISTRDMVDIPELLRSEIYNDYLNPRGLHEGLRLALFADADHIQDISFLRPWSAGPFDAPAIRMGEGLLPHLQRAAAVTRRMQASQFSIEDGTPRIDGTRTAVVIVDAAGAPLSVNPAAERLLASRTGFRLSRSGLHAATTTATAEIQHAIARAAGRAGPLRGSSLLRLPGPDQAGPFHVMVIPLSVAAVWAMPRAPAVMVIFRDPSAVAVSAARLCALFGLTRAEADLAQRLLAGDDLREIAEGSGRSLHTVRNHLARLMSKTSTNRQSELIRLLADVATMGEPSPDDEGSPLPAPLRPPPIAGFPDPGSGTRPCRSA